MKILLILPFILIYCSAFSQLSSKIDSVSYSLGVLVGMNMSQQGFENLDRDIFAKAVTSVLDGKDVDIPSADAQKIVNDYLLKQEEDKYKMNKEAGEMFLKKNANRDGVVTMDNGLQYEIIKEGTGDKPTLSDKVKVHYHGTLPNGDVFDSSVDRGEPISFNLNGVIKGWQIGLQQMSVGSKYKLFIPYDLAYGPNAAGDKIKPYSALIFEVELLDIE